MLDRAFHTRRGQGYSRDLAFTMRVEVHIWLLNPLLATKTDDMDDGNSLIVQSDHSITPAELNLPALIF